MAGPMQVQKQSAQGRADVAPFAAENARSAQHDGGNHVELEAEPQPGRFDRDVVGHVEQGRQAEKQSADDERLNTIRSGRSPLRRQAISELPTASQRPRRLAETFPPQSDRQRGEQDRSPHGPCPGVMVGGARRR